MTLWCLVAEPLSVEAEDRNVVKRVVTVKWKPGDGPRVTVVARRANRSVTHEAALLEARLTYTYESELQAWAQDADLTAVVPVGTGWSRYPTPVVGSNSPGRLEVARALHDQYRPRTTVTLTEQEKSA